MEAATDTTNAPEAASTSKDARTQEPYRQEAGTIPLAATPGSYTHLTLPTLAKA